MPHRCESQKTLLSPPSNFSVFHSLFVLFFYLKKHLAEARASQPFTTIHREHRWEVFDLLTTPQPSFCSNFNLGRNRNTHKRSRFGLNSSSPLPNTMIHWRGKDLSLLTLVAVDPSVAATFHSTSSFRETSLQNQNSLLIRNYFLSSKPFTETLLSKTSNFVKTSCVL